MNPLKSCPPRPLPQRRFPLYPRAILAAGLAINVAGCFGAAPAPYQPAQSPQPPAATTYAQPPQTDPPADPDGKGDDPPAQLAGEAPEPFDQ